MTNGIPHRGIPFFVADDVRYNFSVYDVVRKGMPTSMRQGFDNEKYIELQAANIRKRIAQFGGKLYLEFGGKLFDDYHASRVLPGFEPDTKFRMLESLVDDVEIVIAINANHVLGDLEDDNQFLAYIDDSLTRAQAQALDAVAAYTQTFNKMGFIETEERDEIYMALRGILDALPDNTLQKDALIEKFEQLRDF